MKKILLSVFLVLLFVTVAFADEQQGLEQQNSQISQRMAELKRRENEKQNIKLSKKLLNLPLSKLK